MNFHSSGSPGGVLGFLLGRQGTLLIQKNGSEPLHYWVTKLLFGFSGIRATSEKSIYIYIYIYIYNCAV